MPIFSRLLLQSIVEMEKTRVLNASTLKFFIHQNHFVCCQPNLTVIFNCFICKEFEYFFGAVGTHIFGISFKCCSNFSTLGMGTFYVINIFHKKIFIQTLTFYTELKSHNFMCMCEPKVHFIRHNVCFGFAQIFL